MNETRAMQIDLSISMWSGEAVDNSLARDTESRVAAESGSMRVVKELAPKEYINPIRNAAAAGRATHHAMTLPGIFRGTSILSIDLYEKYILKQMDAKEVFDRSVKSFVDAYPSILRNAQVRLGAAFDVSDFPSVATLPRRFEYKVRAFPIPTSRDWRLEGIVQADRDVLREQVEESVKNMYRNATEELYSRLDGAIGRLAKQLDADEPRVREATITNLKEIIDLVPAMNVADDPELYKLAVSMQKTFNGITAVSVNSSARTADLVKAAIKQAMERING